MPDPTPSPDPLPGLGVEFIHRVYRTSLVVGFLAAALLWEGAGLPVALGWILGFSLSLAGLASMEWSVRRFISPERQTARPLVGIGCLKLLVAVAVLGIAFIGASRGWVSLIAVLAGFALPHAVLLLKLVGQKVLALLNEDQNAARPQDGRGGTPL